MNFSFYKESSCEIEIGSCKLKKDAETQCALVLSRDDLKEINDQSDENEDDRLYKAVFDKNSPGWIPRRLSDHIDLAFASALKIFRITVLPGSNLATFEVDLYDSENSPEDRIVSEC